MTLIISFALLNENHDAALGIASAVFASFSIAFVLTERRYLLGNIFMSTWMICFHFSLYKLSGLQYSYPSSIGWYIVLIGLIPLLVEYIIKGKESGTCFSRDARHAAIEIGPLFVYALALASAVLFALVIREYGIFATEGERQMITSNAGLIVACEVLVRISFYFSAFLFVSRGDKRLIPVMIYAFVYGLASMSRSLLVSFLVYYALLGLVIKKTKTMKLVILAVAAFVLFGILGNIREGVSFSISNYASLASGSSVVDWVYSYVCPNFDNLALQIQYGQPSNTLSYFLRPIITLFGLDDASWYSTGYVYVGRLNLGTMFRDYVCDVGGYALVPFVLTIVALVCILYFKSNDDHMTIIKMIILSEIALAPLTNHFTSSVFWLSVAMVLAFGFLLLDFKRRLGKVDEQLAFQSCVRGG